MQEISEAPRISPSAADYSVACLWDGCIAHVATEMKNEAAISKEARKAREEANLRHRNPRKPPKGGGDGGGAAQGLEHKGPCCNPYWGAGVP